MTLEIDELNRRGAIAAAASLVTGVLVSVGGVPVPADAVAQARQNAPASKDRVGDTDDEEEVSTLRLALLRIGALVRRSVRRISVAMASAHPYRDEFALAHARLTAAPA